MEVVDGNIVTGRVRLEAGDVRAALAVETGILLVEHTRALSGSRGGDDSTSANGALRECEQDKLGLFLSRMP